MLWMPVQSSGPRHVEILVFDMYSKYHLNLWSSKDRSLNWNLDQENGAQVRVIQTIDLLCQYVSGRIEHTILMFVQLSPQDIHVVLTMKNYLTFY